MLGAVALLCHEDADPHDDKEGEGAVKSIKRDRKQVSPAEAKLEMMNLLTLFSRGRRPRPDDARTVRVCRRLFAALVLRQLINEVGKCFRCPNPVATPNEPRSGPDSHALMYPLMRINFGARFWQDGAVTARHRC